MGEGCAAGKRPARRKRERLSLRALESRVPGQGKILEPGAAKSEAREQGKRSRHGRVGFYLQAMKPGFSCIDDPGVVKRSGGQLDQNLMIPPLGPVEIEIGRASLRERVCQYV